MTYEERLRLHLADKRVTWQTGSAATYAAWDEDGPRAVALLPQPVTAASLVDAYVARPPGARLTVVHEGPLGPVALRSAARFGIDFLDAATLPAAPTPEPAFAPAPQPAADAPALPEVVLAVEAPAPVAAPEPAFVEPVPLHAPVETPLLPAPEPAALLPEPEATPLLPAHVETPAAEVAPAPLVAVAEVEVAVDGPAQRSAAETELDVATDVAAEPPAPLFAEPEAAVAPAVAEVVLTVEVPAVEALPEPAVFAPVEAAPPAVEAASAPAPLAPLVEGAALPWDPVVAPAAEPAPAIQVTAGELAALPWHHHAPIEEHVEIMAGSPRARRHVDRPTLAGPDAPGWGLPWPRPVPQTDGLSIADPRIWASQERVHAMRDDLDAQVGAASFGAVKPDGSAWLKRIQTFGPP